MKYYTIYLSIICVFMFILQSVIPGFTDSLLLNHSSFSQPWRFVTAIFLHGSLQHIVLNLFALILFGLILESLISSRRFIIVFFTSGIFANLVSVFFYPSSLGASGTIFGILGALTIIKPLMVVWVYSLPMPMFLAALIWALVSIFGIINPSNVGDIAHLSGLLVGLILGLYLRIKHFRKEKLRADYSRINISEQDMRNWENRYLK